MELPAHVAQCIESSTGKALATNTADCLHVVPVSKIKVVDNTIWLVNYFMGQTITNITENPRVSLACWQGLEGYQIKGSVQYVTEGEIFSAMVEEAAAEFPDRTVSGVLIITPEELYDVSATADRPGEKIA